MQTHRFENSATQIRKPVYCPGSAYFTYSGSGAFPSRTSHLGKVAMGSWWSSRDAGDGLF